MLRRSSLHLSNISIDWIIFDYVICSTDSLVYYSGRWIIIQLFSLRRTFQLEWQLVFLANYVRLCSALMCLEVSIYMTLKRVCLYLIYTWLRCISALQCQFRLYKRTFICFIQRKTVKKTKENCSIFQATNLMLRANVLVMFTLVKWC